MSLLAIPIEVLLVNITSFLPPNDVSKLFLLNKGVLAEILSGDYSRIFFRQICKLWKMERVKKRASGPWRVKNRLENLDIEKFSKSLGGDWKKVFFHMRNLKYASCCKCLWNYQYRSDAYTWICVGCSHRKCGRTDVGYTCSGILSYTYLTMCGGRDERWETSEKLDFRDYADAWEKEFAEGKYSCD